MQLARLYLTVTENVPGADPIPSIGFTLILIVSPVAADLSYVVEEKEKADPDVFGPRGAYAQAFALFNCAMAAATLFGPVVAGTLRERYDWGMMSAAVGVFAFSGAIPAVSARPNCKHL